MTTTTTVKFLIVCHECGKRFKKAITPRTVEIKCPGCGGYDTMPEGY